MKRFSTYLILLYLLISCDLSPDLQRSGSIAANTDRQLQKNLTAYPILSESIELLSPKDWSAHTFRRIMRKDTFFHSLDSSIILSTRYYDLGRDTLYIIECKEYEKGSDFYYNLEKRLYQKKDLSKPVTEILSDYPGDCGDELIDANFDGRLDYVSKYYSGTGCCPRSSVVVYLNKEAGLKSDGIHVFNGYFDGRRKTVYQMSYGFPPFISYDKYVWSADSLVRIESIGYNIVDWATEEVDTLAPFIKYDLIDSQSVEINEFPKEYDGVRQGAWGVLGTLY